MIANQNVHVVRFDRQQLGDPSRVVVVCGCCHAGLLNTLLHVRRVFNQEITAIIGGTHLTNVNADTIAPTITLLHTTTKGHVPYMYLTRCAGEHALVALSQDFDGQVKPCPAGTVL